MSEIINNPCLKCDRGFLCIHTRYFTGQRCNYPGGPCQVPTIQPSKNALKDFVGAKGS